MENLTCFKDGKVKLDSIQPGETVLAVRYVNGAWGYQDTFIVIDKEGNCKFQDQSTWDNVGKEVENLLSCMDACLADENIPYEEVRFDCSEELLETVVSTADFELEPTGREQYDAGEMECYVVFGSGKERTLACMQQDGNSESRSHYSNVRKLCEEMLDLYNKLQEMHRMKD